MPNHFSKTLTGQSHREHSSHGLILAVAPAFFTYVSSAQAVGSALTPVGLLATNTACLSGWMRILMPVFWLGRKLTVLPQLRFFTSHELVESLEAAGFEIEFKRRPGARAAVFIVARKPALHGSA